MTGNVVFNRQKDIRIPSSLIQQAVQDDQKAIALMFQQFIPDDETIYFAQYLGLKGLWGIGTREFACLTDRRVADITVGRFGKIDYQDGYLEHINSSFIYQPSKLGLYIAAGVLFAPFAIALITTLLNPVNLIPGLIFSTICFGIGLILLPFIVQLYYRFKKCGIVISVRGGLPVYIFTNRKLLTRANALWRLLTTSREERIKLTGVV
ncbi:hypothetical protein CEN50_19280 [Fischerella thermalis CCMEE 5268]|uniref:Uncharacterized protein n=1 Tax=Fischerella thermalis CCMEE 5268 TaxID=2019662 RepID=A0A2N6KCA4_9CYAN|nr:hypothetical protein [Fischerella thermalis]PLZ96260.1 hypothetical protein CEN50_19280 [Fischerella thermalis CCMEE 5268]